MRDDPRNKRVLDRYRKEKQFLDASMDVSSLGIAELLRACRSDDPDYLTTPRELDAYAGAHPSGVMGIEFKPDLFGYVLHSNVRAECALELSTDPDVTSPLLCMAGGAPLPSAYVQGYPFPRKHLGREGLRGLLEWEAEALEAGLRGQK
jgi:hypothetical protein